MIDNIEKLNQILINSTDFKKIDKDYFLSTLLDVDDIILIEDVFIYKGKKMIFRGNQKKVNKEDFSLFLREHIKNDLCRNYIIVINNKNVYTINEDGVINRYNNINIGELQ